MCARYTLTSKAEAVEQHLKIRVDKSQYAQTWNAAPGEKHLVVSAQDKTTANWFLWGLIPHWATDKKISNPLINARSETIEDKPTFKRLLQKNRCLVVTDGFYEWKKIGKESIPYYVRFRDQRIFCIAGLWDNCYNSTGNQVQSFTIITTPANKLVSPIHNRMPVIINHSNERKWLDNSIDTAHLTTLLRPYPTDSMLAYPVSKMVNSAKNNYASLIENVEQTNLLFSI